MRVLVTGGAGFIGSHLVQQLLERGHSVAVLDDLSTGQLSNLPVDAPGLEVRIGSITDPEVVEEMLIGRDALVHLAAIASVEASVQSPLRTHKTNLEGSIRLFDTAARLGVSRVLYASSAAVYGDTSSLPISETSKKEPLSPYAADKYAGEHYLAYYHRRGLLKAKAFRFFNVFGPRQDPSSPYSGVISIFLDRARKNEDVVIYGDGKQTRDFVYVSDVVAALELHLESDSGREDMPVYNVGRGEEVDLLGLVQMIRTLPNVNGPLEVGHQRARDGDIRRSVADVNRLKATGWHPQVTVREGLVRTYEE